MNVKTFRLGPLFQTQYALIWVLLVIIAYFSITSSVFRSPENLLEILRSSAITAILVLGLTWIVATGEIDLSFPQIAALSCVTCALLIKLGFSFWSTVLISLAIGTAIGTLCGFLVGIFKFPGLITSIGFATLAKAMAETFSEGAPIYIAAHQKIIYGLVYGLVGGIPVLFLIALAIYVVCLFIQEKTITGHHLYALGENRKATQEAGINESKIIFYFFILSGILASIGGVLYTAAIASGNPEIGDSFFLDGLTAVFLGALIIKAGKPNVVGTFLGIILLVVLFNGLTLQGIPNFIGLVIKGVLLFTGIVVVTYSRYRKKLPGTMQV
jgi:ribose transport system permease protein